MKNPLHDFFNPDACACCCCNTVRLAKPTLNLVGVVLRLVSRNFYFGFPFFACGCETLTLRGPLLVGERPLDNTPTSRLIVSCSIQARVLYRRGQRETIASREDGDVQRQVQGGASMVRVDLHSVSPLPNILHHPIPHSNPHPPPLIHSPHLSSLPTASKIQSPT